MEDVLASGTFTCKTIGVLLTLPYKMQIKRAKFCIIFIRLLIFWLFCKGIAKIKDAVDTIEAWNTKSESLKELQNELLSWLFLGSQSTKSLIWSFLILKILNSAIFF